jgi:hypothetical protein
MIYHVLPGDSLVSEFKETNIDGEVVVCREAFITGPVDADVPDAFWAQRARFILAEYSEDEIEYHERVADQLEKLRDLDAEDEVNLWFEYELFCSVNFWFCSSLVAETGATLYRVEPVILETKDRWKGFGSLDANGLSKCFDQRKRLSDEDTSLGVRLWDAFRKGDHVQLLELSDSGSEVFPYLDEVIAAAVEIETRPARIIKDIYESGNTEFESLFPEFVERAGVYGFGDLQVQNLFERIYS